MKELQELLAEMESCGGGVLLTPQIVLQFQRPLDREGLALLARCIELSSEQIYEHYRALIDLFRKQAALTTPDAATIRRAVRLGLLDDEEWLPIAAEQEG